MKYKKILIAAAVLFFVSAILCRVCFPSNAAAWPYIYLLPGFSFLITGILWQKKRYVLPAAQIMFSLCVASCLAEVFFQKKTNADSAEAVGRRIWLDTSVKSVERNGKFLPVLSPETFIDPASLSGYTPNIHGVHRSRRIFPDGSVKTAFEAEYMLNDLGFRKVPCGTQNASEPPLLFFGDSFTFGEGVDNDKVYVNKIAMKLSGIRNVYNYAVPGASPVNFLYFLNHNALEKSGLSGKLNSKAYYLIINDHQYRVLGSKFQESVSFLPAGDRISLFLCYWLKIRVFYKSMLCDALLGKLHRNIYIGYLKETSRILKEKYAVDLTVIVYPDCDSAMVERLSGSGLRLIFLSEVMPDYHEKGRKRLINPVYEIRYDGHPNAHTHDIISKRILKDLYPEQ